MSYARPVVAFNVGATSEWFEDSVTGFLTPPYDETVMAQRIGRLLGNAMRPVRWAGRDAKRWKRSSV
jgi:glycosyltransferase involved in cell wall biosynthesis